MALARLSGQQFDDLLKITNYYRIQAERCRNSKAYLAGCVMLGSALVGMLVIMMSLYMREAARSKKLPCKSNGKPKPLLRWTLFELLAVAKDLHWLPAQLSLDDEFDSERAAIGDYAEVIRQVRNLVHPAGYLDVYHSVVLRKKQYDIIYEILATAVDWLMQKIYRSLGPKIEKSQQANAPERLSGKGSRKKRK